MDYEQENKRLNEDFNIQRAKFREMYRQREAEVDRLNSKNGELASELDALKSRLLNIELEKERELEELTSLKLFIQETINKSPDADAHRKLYEQCEQLKRENFKLKELLSETESNSLAPVLNQVKKFALKFGTDNSNEGGPVVVPIPSPGKYDQEDELNLVEPLEAEVKALKEKLRSTDEELQKYRNNPQPSAACSKCEQTMNAAAISETDGSAQEKEMLQKHVARLQEDLVSESKLRSALEREWEEKRDQHKDALNSLTDQLKKSEESVEILQRHYSMFRENIKQELVRMVEEREQMFRQLDTCQRENELLAGFYIKNVAELEDQEINLPSNVEELQEMLLKARQMIIETKVGLESVQIKSVGLHDELQLLRGQLENVHSQKREADRLMKNQLAEIERMGKMYHTLTGQLGNEKAEREKSELECKREREQTIELRTLNEKSKKLIEELRGKVATLQQDLANGEEVQKDFVCLSQSLQMQLEKIRVADTQVRWQDEDDVDKCSNCKVAFTVTKRKQHCRHCGSIYCDQCVSKVVLTGPRKREARVCDVCHTLLNSHTAPFFSSVVPQPMD